MPPPPANHKPHLWPAFLHLCTLHKSLHPQTFAQRGKDGAGNIAI